MRLTNVLIIRDSAALAALWLPGLLLPRCILKHVRTLCVAVVRVCFVCDVGLVTCIYTHSLSHTPTKCYTYKVLCRCILEHVCTRARALFLLFSVHLKKCCAVDVVVLRENSSLQHAHHVHLHLFSAADSTHTHAHTRIHTHTRTNTHTHTHTHTNTHTHTHTRVKVRRLTVCRCACAGARLDAQGCILAGTPFA